MIHILHATHNIVSNIFDVEKVDVELRDGTNIYFMVNYMSAKYFESDFNIRVFDIEYRPSLF